MPGGRPPKRRLESTPVAIEIDRQDSDGNASNEAEVAPTPPIRQLTKPFTRMLDQGSHLRLCTALAHESNGDLAAHLILGERFIRRVRQRKTEDGVDLIPDFETRAKDWTCWPLPPALVPETAWDVVEEVEAIVERCVRDNGVSVDSRQLSSVVDVLGPAVSMSLSRTLDDVLLSPTQFQTHSIHQGSFTLNWHDVLEAASPFVSPEYARLSRPIQQLIERSRRVIRNVAKRMDDLFGGDGYERFDPLQPSEATENMAKALADETELLNPSELRFCGGKPMYITKAGRPRKLGKRKEASNPQVTANGRV